MLYYLWWNNLVQVLSTYMTNVQAICGLNNLHFSEYLKFKKIKEWNLHH